MSFENAWVLEWHQKSNSFHVQPLDKLLSKNREAYANNAEGQNWRVLHIGTKDECEAAANAARPTLRRRNMEINRAMLEWLET